MLATILLFEAQRDAAFAVKAFRLYLSSYKLACRDAFKSVWHELVVETGQWAKSKALHQVNNHACSSAALHFAHH